MPADLTDVDAFSDPITVPSDGDPLNSASVVTTGLQRLANRTRHLFNIVKGTTNLSPKLAKTRRFSPLVFRYMLSAISTEAPGRTVAPASGDGRRVRLDSNNVEAVASLNELLPFGAELTLVRLSLVAGTHSVAGRLSIFAKQIDDSGSTPIIGEGSEVAGANTSGTGLQKVTLSGSPIFTLSGALDTYDLVYDPVGVDDFDLIEGLLLGWNDPGPRNF